VRKTLLGFLDINIALLIDPVFPGMLAIAYKLVGLLLEAALILLGRLSTL
jgi:hypothetical protein